MDPFDKAEEEENKYFLRLCCFKSFNYSKLSEEWIHCTRFRLWAHESCVPGGQDILCLNLVL